MKRLLYYLIQLTWGIIQTTLGFIIFLIFIRNRHVIFNGAIATEWHRYDGLSLGLFIFVPENIEINKKYYIYKHEYGHTIQSLILGPLYLLIIGLPSLIWSKLYHNNMTRNNKNNYYDFFTERSANYFGKNNDNFI